MWRGTSTSLAPRATSSRQTRSSSRVPIGREPAVEPQDGSRLPCRGRDTEHWDGESKFDAKPNVRYCMIARPQSLAKRGSRRERRHHAAKGEISHRSASIGS